MEDPDNSSSITTPWGCATFTSSNSGIHAGAFGTHWSTSARLRVAMPPAERFNTFKSHSKFAQSRLAASSPTRIGGTISRPADSPSVCCRNQTESVRLREHSGTWRHRRSGTIPNVRQANGPDPRPCRSRNRETKAQFQGKP